MRLSLRLALLASAFCAAAPVAWADDAAPSDSIWQRANLLGDMGGLRSGLADKGVTLTATEQAEMLGNTLGGLKRGFTVDGLTTITARIDAEKAFGWTGGTINISALSLHGHALSPGYLGNLQTASGIAGTPTTRLWETWVQQSFADGAFDVKLGQQSLDQEFLTSTNAAIFVNTMMGWPMVPSADLYAGGPAYPLSSLGIRLRAQAMDNFTFLAGVFDDNAPGGSFNNDSQLRGTTRAGVNASLRTGALFIAEAQYAVNQKTPGDSKAPEDLPLAAKLGMYVDTGDFYDQQYAANGNLLVLNPSAAPRVISGNSSVYALLDAGVWKQGGDSARMLSVFGRVMFAPTNQNLVDFSANGGITLSAPLAGRDDDTFGLGFGYAHLSSRASAYSRGMIIQVVDGAVMAVPSNKSYSETFIEATYQAQVTPWLQIQPDLQFISHPGGGAINPSTGKRIADELVIGLRTNITF